MDASTLPRVGQQSRWTTGRIAAVSVGVLVVLLSIGLLGGGGTLLWADWTQRDGGFVTTDSHHFSTGGSALATESTHLGAARFGWLYSPGLLGKVRIRVFPAGAQPLFVGIARSSDADTYLTGVSHTVISDFFGGKTETVDGGALTSHPGTQAFWAASSTGAGVRSLVWKPRSGHWTVVVMNATGQPGIDVKADLGARLSSIPWIGAGLLTAGAIFFAGGALLMVGALRRAE